MQLAKKYSFQLGAGERTRTPDLRITNALLYRLSYTSIFNFPGRLNCHSDTGN